MELRPIDLDTGLEHNGDEISLHRQPLVQSALADVHVPHNR
jgi:hypothetical protein